MSTLFRFIIIPIIIQFFFINSLHNMLLLAFLGFLFVIQII